MAETDVKKLLAKVNTKLFINGEWRDSASGRTFDVENPATGEILASVADATADDGKAALAAADEARASWAATPSRERAELLRRAFDAVTSRADEFATLMTLEMGKPFKEAKGEVTYGAEFLRWFSEIAAHIGGEYRTNPEGTARILTVERPVGPCLIITPWNFPLAMATRKIGPALAAGCTVVVKPAELTPLTMHYFVQTLEEVGLPKGVVNLIPTTSAGEVTGPLFDDERLRKVSFTGSTGVGKKLLEQSAKRVLRTSMELGGNAPLIVFEDADLDKAVEGTMLAKMRNTGEACTAANRLLVHESVAPEFAKRLTEKMAALRIGNGLDESTTLGPIIDRKSLDKIAGLVDEAVEQGAEVLTGGKRTGDRGYFYEPTVLTNVPRDAEITSTEIFGPVAPITTFSTEDEAVELANATEFGLMAYVFTGSLERGLRMPEKLETGMIGLNSGVISNAAAPFGGVKQSGIGREGGMEGIREYLTTVYVGTPL